MAKNSWYAWHDAEGNGDICKTWEECQRACSGKSGEKHKGFKTCEEAFAFAHPGMSYPDSNTKNVPLISQGPDSCPKNASPIRESSPIQETPTEQEVQSVTPTSVVAAPSVPYQSDEELDQFLQEYYPERAFTDDQKAAIQAFQGAHLLYAIPGSGKTAVLTARAGYMIYQGIPAENILIMTFGKNAAAHMADVFRDRFPAYSLPTFSTIHSFCYRVIREAEEKGLLEKHRLICDEEDDPVPEAMEEEAKNAWITDESADDALSGKTQREDKRKGNRYANPRNPIYLLESILTELEYCKKRSDARGPAEQVATIIGCIKNRMMTEKEIQSLPSQDLGADMQVNIWAVYAAYQQELAQHQPPEMDFDDMLLLALEVLRNPEMQDYWQRKYPYICIDEAQDTSLLQHAIVQKMYRSDGSLFMVGDDDQSIYAFRGATPRAMLEFDQHYENAFVHRMGMNFRSDQLIVHSGDSLIQRNKTRANKPMKASSKQRGKICITDISTSLQGQFLLDQVRQFCAEQEGKDSPESLAILYRNNASALLPLAFFFRYNIPFFSNKVFDILSILYSRTAINILALLQFIVYPDDFSAYSRAYPAWNCYHGLFLNRETAVEKFKEWMHTNSSDKPVLPQLQEMLLFMGESEKARHIGEVWEILQRLRAEDRPDSAIIVMLKDLWYNKNRHMMQSNVQLLVTALIQIASLYDSILGYLDAMLSMRAKRKWDEHNKENSAVVTLSTMHSAKGQEYDHVIIIDATVGIMPGDPSKPLPIWNNSWLDHVEEERRLFYVAATRAKHDLRIVVNGLNGNGSDAPCPFIHEMLRDYPEIPVENLSGYAADNQLEEELDAALGIPYYAVRIGKAPGVYRDYEKAGVKGFSSPVYRKCPTWREANRFLNKSVQCLAPDIAPESPLPGEVEHALLSMFSVQRLQDLSVSALESIRIKTDWLFSKDSNYAKAVDYTQCAMEYALQYLPVNAHKVWQPLMALLRDERLPVQDEYKYPDGSRPIHIMEIGVGPGTATVGVLSFYAMIAEANPSVEICLEYLPVEYEQAFKPVFNTIITALLSTLPRNLHVTMKPMLIQNAFTFLHTYPESNFDLILESNMLNHNEHVNEDNMDGFIRDLNRALVYSGKAIVIEPADEATASFLTRLTNEAANCCGFGVMGPVTAANTVSGVRLNCDAVACGLRDPLEEEQHWFRYTILTKQ